jgi:RHS repeat-associated protein
MSGPAAARIGDPIAHESLMSEIGQVGAGLLTGLAVGFAVGAAAAFIVGTGGLGAVVLGAVVATAITYDADTLMHAAGAPGLSDLPGLARSAVAAPLDSMFPPVAAGTIVQGSPDIFINGKPAARAMSDGADNLVACDQHSPPQYVAEGSASVFFNGVPAHRVGDRTTCGAKTSAGSSNVFIGGPPVATREISSGMPWWLDKADMIVGIALAVCTRDWKSIPGKLLCLGVGMAASAATDYVLHGGFGKPVHAATGAKFLDGSDDLDFELPASLPLRWERRYNSMDAGDGPLGPGWRLPVTVTLSVTGGAAVLTDAQGIEIPFGTVARGAAVGNVSYGWTLGRIAKGNWVAEDPAGLFYDFGPGEDDSVLALQRVEDRNGNRIALHYDEAGRLAELVDSAGRVYACTYDETHARRIAEIAWVRNPSTQVILVRYAYDPSGRLAEVTNRAGEIVRRFEWHEAGPGRGLLASHTLPSGLVCHYAWAGFPASHPRVTRHWTSAGEEWRAAYGVNPDGRSGTTTVTDHLGRAESWDWIGPHQVTAYTDALGRTWRWRYDAAGLPLGCTEPDGAEWSNRYDDRGNLVEAIDPLGGRYRTRWRSDLALPLAESGPDGAETRYQYDHKGNLLAVTHPGGRVEFTRDETGELMVLRDEAGRESRWERRPDGQAAAYTDCSGKTVRWDYDEEGRVIRQTDAAGNVTRFGWDRAARLAARQTPDGIRQFWRWQPGGYLERMERAGSVTGYAWDRSGRLTGTTDPEGNIVERGYDGGGRLVLLIDGDGRATRFEHDACDRLVAETGIDGLRTEYALDVRGRPVEVVRAAGTADAVTLKLERDLLGRLVAKHTEESLTRYAYDLAGRVIAVKRFALDGETVADEIGFAYDAAGRLVEETTTIHRLGGRRTDLPGQLGQWKWTALPEPRRTTIRHERDALGNIIGTALPHGPDLRYLRYGSGHLLQINLGDEVLSEMVRDDLHREVVRSQGAIESRFGLDPMGRRLSLRAGSGEALAFGTGLSLRDLVKDYRYDAQGLLARRRDPWFGERRLAYDAAGRITANENAATPRVAATAFDPFTEAVASNPFDEAFQWDRASNVLPLDRTGLRVLSGETELDRVIRCGDCVYRYDAHGRMTQKKTRTGERIFLTWNSEHQLVRSWSARGGEWSYHYDALGRRIAKQCHDNRSAERTWFVWDGMRMVQEEHSSQLCITTIYEDAGSYVPLARVEHRVGQSAIRPEQIFYVHTDVNGAPEELTTPGGRVAWRARYQTWGNLALEEWDRSYERDPALRRRAQNLRFQGQYYDAETGLHYNTFRYYDPDCGRFASQDPIGLRGGLNLYQYAPDPISWIDPWGLCVSGFNGRRGISKAEFDLERNGFKVIGREVTMKVNGSRIRADLVAEDSRGNIHVFESKFGSGRLTGNQSSSGVFDMNSPSNTSVTGGGTITPSSGTTSQYKVATKGQPGQALGGNGATGNATFHVLKYQ